MVYLNFKDLASCGPDNLATLHSSSRIQIQSEKEIKKRANRLLPADEMSSNINFELNIKLPTRERGRERERDCINDDNNIFNAELEFIFFKVFWS